MAGKDPLRPGWSALENGRKTGLPERKIRQGFWPGTKIAENVPCWALRSRVYPRPEDSSHAKPRHAGIRRAAGLDGSHAGKGGRLRRGTTRSPRETAGGCAPPGDRRRVGTVSYTHLTLPTKRIV